MFAYLYFIVYLKEKQKNACNGVEKYVKEQIEKDDISFFPLGKSIDLGIGTDDA